MSAPAIAFTHGAEAPFRRLPAADRDLIERAAVGLEVVQGKWKLYLIVAMARGDQFPKRVGHRLHLRDARLKIADMRFRDAPNLPAWAAAVAP